MATRHASVSLPINTPVLLSKSESDFSRDQNERIILQPQAAIHIGGAGVTAATGLPVASGATLTIDLGPDDELYAVAAAATTVRVLNLGVV